MAKSVQLKRVLAVYLLCCWCAVVYASELTFAQGIDSVPFKAIGFIFILSVFGGMAGTLPKLVNPDIKVRNVWLEMAKDIVASIVAGFFIFFITTWQEWSWALQCGLILIGGVGGTKVLDYALAKRLFPVLDRLFGENPAAVVPPPAKEETPP